MKLFSTLLLIINLSLFADEKLGGQEIIERLDRTLAINDGLTRARLSIKKGNHETHFWKVNIFNYNVLSGKFYGIEQMEKMERVLHSSFTYLDLSNLSYEANYSAAEVNKTKTETSETSILKMTPLSTPSYKYLELQVDNTDYAPRKIDFTSHEGFLIKTMKFRYGKIKVRESNSNSEISSLNRLEMTDNATGLVSILEFTEIDKDIKPDKIIYEMKTMFEK